VPPTSDLLPHVDEHTVSIDAEPSVTWAALERVVDRSFSSATTARFAGLIGCIDTESTGPRPFAAGSVVPGFHVEHADPERELTLVGAHRFSAYALVFRLEAESGGHTLVRAETRADFPGVKGSIYRGLVIGTRIHVLVTRRLLRATKRSAERERAGAT
jgi:hypothetical protein